MKEPAGAIRVARAMLTLVKREERHRRVCVKVSKSALTRPSDAKYKSRHVVVESLGESAWVTVRTQIWPSCLGYELWFPS